MAYYKLVAKGRSDVVVDEIVLDRSESGEVTSSISTNQVVEIDESDLDRARNAASLVGYQVVEADSPAEQDEERPVGADTAQQSPVVEQADRSSSGINQQKTQESQTPNSL